MLTLLLPLLAAAAPASERPPIRFGADQVIDVVAPTNDLFAFAQRVAVKHPVDDNVFAFAQQIVIDEDIDGDLYAFAQSVEVRADVRGDLYAFASDVRIADSGSVGGDVILGAGNLDIAGEVHGDIQGGVGNAVLDGTVDGLVELEAGNLVIGGDADIGGDLRYTSAQPARIDDAAVVRGTVRFEQQVAEVATSAEPEPETGGWFSGLLSALFWKGWRYIGGLIVGTVLLGLGGRAAARPGRVLAASPGMSLGVGFALACLVPFASTLAIVTLVPLPLGVLGFVAYFTAVYLACLVVGQAIGDAILARLRPGSVGSPWMSLAVGLAVLTAAMALPWVGTLVWLAAVFAGLGGIGLAFRDARRDEAAA